MQSENHESPAGIRGLTDDEVVAVSGGLFGIGGWDVVHFVAGQIHPVVGAYSKFIENRVDAANKPRNVNWPDGKPSGSPSRTPTVPLRVK
jgi:hypothetical protein